jgi:hypothetical protein
MEQNRNSELKNVPLAHHTGPPQRKTVSLVTAWIFHKGMGIRFWYSIFKWFNIELFAILLC